MLFDVCAGGNKGPARVMEMNDVSSRLMSPVILFAVWKFLTLKPCPVLQKFAVKWNHRTEEDYQAIGQRATYTEEIVDDSPKGSDAPTPMKPLVPKIESQECIMKLVRENSPVSQSASRKYIPKVLMCC